MSKFNIDDYPEFEGESQQENINSVETKKNSTPIQINSKFKIDNYPEIEPEMKNTNDGREFGGTRKKEEMLSGYGNLSTYLNEFYEGASSGFGYGISAGMTQNIKGSETDFTKPGTVTGALIGASIPFSAAYKAIAYPMQAIKNIKDISIWAVRGANLLPAFGAGASYETAREVVAGEDLNVKEIAKAGAGALAFEKIIMGTAAGIKLLSSLPKDQAQQFAKGLIPENIDPRTYKFYRDEVLPEVLEIAKKDYHQATAEANKQLKISNKQAESIAQAEFETKEFSNEQEYQQALEAHKNELKNIATKHENQLMEIEKFNKEAEKNFAEAERNFQQVKTRDEIVEDTIKNQELENQRNVESIENENLSKIEKVNRKISPTGFQFETKTSLDSPLKNRIGNFISPVQVVNDYNAGQTSMKTVQTTSEIDYKFVNEAYTRSENLNSKLQNEDIYLSNWLISEIRELKSIPHLSGPKERLLKSYTKVLEATTKFDEDGNIIGYKPISNKVLLEQAKELRYSVDYDFAQGNPSKIFQPFINELQDSADRSAQISGNEEAYQSNVDARTMYREWSKTYNDEYIKKYRDLSNKDFAKTFESSLSIDKYKVLEPILNKTNSGRVLLNATRRSLIEKEISKFTKNPENIDPYELNETLRQIDTVLRTGEEEIIRQEISNKRKQLPKTQEKLKSPKLTKPPKPPKLKKYPTQVEIPLPPKKKEIKFSKTPKYKKLEETPEMIAASKLMKIKPEQLMNMTETPSDIIKLKNTLDKSNSGKKLFSKIGEYKIRDILHDGKVIKDFSGTEFYELINKKQNLDILSEFLGDKNSLELLNIAKEIGKNKMRWDNAIKLTKNIAIIKFLKEMHVLNIFI